MDRLRDRFGRVPGPRGPWLVGSLLLASTLLAGCNGSSASSAATSPTATNLSWSHTTSSTTTSTSTGSSSTGSTSTTSTSTGSTSTPSSPANKTADVTWTAPTTNSDGSALTDLAGYKVYYGTSPTTLTQSVNVANAGAADYVVQGLTTGTWYFAVSAYTNTGLQSSLSAIVSKTIT